MNSEDDIDKYCGNCIYWHGSREKGMPYGNCHGAAPSSYLNGKAVWPETTISDFCGSWKYNELNYEE